MNFKKRCLMLCLATMLLLLLQPGTLIAQDAPQLEGFMAEWVCGTDTIMLTWETADETDTIGFHIWRSKEIDGVYTRITDELTEGSGGPDQGAVYSYVDDDEDLDRSEAAAEEVSYYYQIEELKAGDVQVFYEPERARDLCDDDDTFSSSCFIQSVSGD